MIASSRIIPKNKSVALVSILALILFIVAITIASVASDLGNGKQAEAISPVVSNKKPQEYDDPTNYTFYRLPPEDQVKPNHYNLRIEVNNNETTFNGHLVMTVTILGPEPEESLEPIDDTDRLIFHAKDLNFSSVFIHPLNGAGDPFYPEVFFQNGPDAENPLDYCILIFPKRYPFGMYNITISYTGSLLHPLGGFYLSPSSTGLSVLSTQFQSTDARRAFPCFDEPSFKATYSLEFVKNESDVRVPRFNMPLEYQETLSNKTHYHFGTTPLMSSYLVAWTFTDYVNRTAIIPHFIASTDLEINVWSPPESFDNTEFALDAAVNITTWLQQFLDADYPLPKMDIFPIPDFGPGAMENWGLITFRPSYVLLNASSSSLHERKRTALIIAHEISHNWFGNLVTCRWWNNIPSHESMATFMEYLAVENSMPNYASVSQDFGSDELQTALKAAGRLTTHPLVISPEIDLNTTAEIFEIFDSITYPFGGSIMRMIEHTIGESKWQSSLQLYIDAHSYSHGSVDEIWNFVGGTPFRDQMHQWTYQPGFPLLTMVQGPGIQVQINQSRFIQYPQPSWSQIITPPSEDWFVPIEYSLNNTISAFNLSTTTSSLFDFDYATADHFTLNNQQYGVYRVDYTDAWPQILTDISSFLQVEKIGILDDAGSFVFPSKLNISFVLDLYEAVLTVPETSINVWSTCLSYLYDFAKLLRYDPVYPKYQARIRSILQPGLSMYSFFGTDDDSWALCDKLLRAAIYFEDDAIITTASEMFLNGSFIHPEIQTAVQTAAVMRLSYENGFKVVQDLYTNYSSNNEPGPAYRALYALAYGSNTPLKVNLVLNMILNDLSVQDISPLLVAVASTDSGHIPAWDFTRLHWSTLYSMYGNGSWLLSRVVSGTTKDFTSQNRYQQIESFFQTNPINGAEKTLLSSLERVASFSYFYDLNGDSLPLMFP